MTFVKPRLHRALNIALDESQMEGKSGFDGSKDAIIKALLDGGWDKSPKGYVDELVLPFFELINGHPDYVTTSSCSGRISLYSEVDLRPPALGQGASRKKKGGCWLFVSHDRLSLPPLASSVIEVLNLGAFKIINNVEGAMPTKERLVYLKFEPFIMHVACRTVECGSLLLKSAISAGFRNSGLVPSTERTLVAIRSTQSLDVPVYQVLGNEFSTRTLQQLVPTAYIIFLLQLANEKWDENLKRLDRLLAAIKQSIYPSAKASNCNNWEDPVARRERKRREGLLLQQSLTLKSTKVADKAQR